MHWPWLNRNKRRRERQEALRLERGKLAEAIVALGQKRHHVEELMKRMLEERRA